jgi:hypothetical protein
MDEAGGCGAQLDKLGYPEGPPDSRWIALEIEDLVGDVTHEIQF